MNYKELEKMILEALDKRLSEVEEDEKKVKVKNRGDVAEGLLAAALAQRFIKGEPNVTPDDVEKMLKDINSKGKSVIDTAKKLGKEKTYSVKRKDGTKDTIRLAIMLARVNFEDLMDPNKKASVQDLYNSVAKYANSKQAIEQSMEFAMDGKSTKVEVIADGVGDQKGTKVDVQVRNDGEFVPLGRISLKAGSTKQLGQISKTFDKAYSKKNSRGLRNLFQALFGVDIGDAWREPYEEALMSGDRFAIGDIVAKVYDDAFEKIKAVYERDDPDEFEEFLRTLARGIKYEAALEEDGVQLVALDKGDFEQLDFTDIEQKVKDLDIDIEVDFDDPGGDYGKELPYLRVYDAGNKKNIISIRPKVRIKDSGELGEFRHYVQKEKGLTDLLKIAKD